MKIDNYLTLLNVRQSWSNRNFSMDRLKNLLCLFERWWDNGQLILLISGSDTYTAHLKKISLITVPHLPISLMY